MNKSTIDILLYALLPVAAIMAGGIIAIVRTLSASLRSAILHFAAGVVFSVVAVELLPQIIKVHAPIEVVIGFGLGIFVMLAVRYFNRNVEKKNDSVSAASVLPIGFLITMGVDLILDGLLMGIGFAAGEKEGILLTVALTIEVFALGLAISAGMSSGNITRRKAIIVILLMAGLFAIGALVGITLLSGLSGNLLEIVLAFGLAALLFLVTEELLTEAHEEAETPLLTATFFAGFLLFLILGMME